MPNYKCECERFAAEGGVTLLHTPQCRFFDQAAVDYYKGFSIDRSICDHGSLRRKCEICERDSEIIKLKKKIEDLEEGLMGYINENGEYVATTFRELEEINEKLLERIEELESNPDIKTMCAHCISATRRFDKARQEFKNLRIELDELDRLRDSQLKPGEYVCRDVPCPSCKGTGESFFSIKKQKCHWCHGTGVMPERVG